MVRIYPPYWKPHTVFRREPVDDFKPQFVIHPSTSELAEQLVVDPEALKNENYSGIYDGEGDYIPMYCDDPEKIPQGSLSANKPTGGNPPAEPSASGGDDKTPPAPSAPDKPVE